MVTCNFQAGQAEGVVLEVVAGVIMGVGIAGGPPERGEADAARAAAHGGPPERGGADAARAAAHGGPTERGGADAARASTHDGLS